MIIQNLKQAILDRNWDLVSECYQALSGEVCVSPSEPNQYQHLIDRLSEMIGCKTVNLPSVRKVEVPQSNDRSVGIDTSVKPKTKRRKVSQSEKLVTASSEEQRNDKNRFNPNEFIGQVLDKDEAKINDRAKPPVERSREPYRSTSVTCDRCRKTFEVNPLFAREDYRCDRCLVR